MIIKCKMCGGDLEFIPGATYGTCEYCGSTMTVPQADDEGKLNRYNRANHFRRQCEFDKAVAAYEKILEQDDADAEAHWGAVISRYGIEYVEDPVSKKRIPTCHRVQIASILADADYLAAVEHAPDTASRELYTAQASEIAEIQKGILTISANEKPYDVFICYKETDENGQRTRDSQWAQDVYYGLTEQGYKVFFSRITLEDKLGQQYEPYIFAALNSAKVMVVIGSKPEFFNAVWVKNEWSRYLSLMAKDRNRLLIPCYRGMDPYDLPEELSNLQSQDMGKIGFMQDLLRGVKKVLDSKNEIKYPNTMQTAHDNNGPGVNSLLRRVFMFLEDGDWQNANEYCEKVLDIDPENGKAYLGKLMAELKVHDVQELQEIEQPFDSMLNYQKVMRYGDVHLKDQLKKHIHSIKSRNEYNRQLILYQNACNLLHDSKTIEDCLRAKHEFLDIELIPDAKEQVKECESRIEKIRETMYNYAVNTMNDAGNDSNKWNTAIELLSEYELSNYRDVKVLKIQASKRYDECVADEEELQRKIAEENHRAAKAASSKRIRNIIIAFVTTIILVVAVLGVTKVYLPKQERESKYTRAKALYEQQDYSGAGALFSSIKGYKDVDILLMSDPLQNKATQDAMFQPGRYVSFGHYPQNRSGTDYSPIEWLVLDRDGQNVLLISHYALDAQPYNTVFAEMTWEKCSLRVWLNHTFLNKAFTLDEQEAILLTNVDNSRNQKYNGDRANGGNNTQDKVFLLSYAEANHYFGVQDCEITGSEKNKKSRVAPTEYAIAQGADTKLDSRTEDGKAAGWWWLRSPSSYQDYAACVFTDGAHNGYSVHRPSGSVRPVMWVNLNAGVFQ